MLGLPKSTETNRQLPKKAFFEKFALNGKDKQRFDSEIRRITIVHEVSSATVNIAAGETVSKFFILLVSLRNSECDKRNLLLLSKSIAQNMLFVLENSGNARLVTVRSGKALESQTKPLDDWTISLTGLNLDRVWENIIANIGCVTLNEGNTLDEELEVSAQREKLQKQIGRIEKLARGEKQPRKKWEYIEDIKRLKCELQ